MQSSLRDVVPPCHAEMVGGLFLRQHAAATVAVAGMVQLLLASGGLFATFGPPDWPHQAPWMMLLPIGYLIAARLWRGHTPERPLGWVAQAVAAVILVPVLAIGLGHVELLVRPAERLTENLLLGLVFVEAAAFYAMAAIFRRRGVNIYFAAASACGALWQFLGYWGIPSPYYAMLYAGLGVAVLVVCRVLGINQVAVYRPTGERRWPPAAEGWLLFRWEMGSSRSRCWRPSSKDSPAADPRPADRVAIVGPRADHAGRSGGNLPGPQGHLAAALSHGIHRPGRNHLRHAGRLARPEALAEGRNLLRLGRAGADRGQLRRPLPRDCRQPRRAGDPRHVGWGASWPRFRS